MHLWPHSGKKQSSDSNRELPEQRLEKDRKYLSIISLPAPCKTGGTLLAEALILRRSVRDFLYEKISLQQLSDLLWAACGVNLIKGTEEKKKYYFTQRWKISLKAYLIFFRNTIRHYEQIESHIKLLECI